MTLLAAASTSRYRSLFEFLVMTGLRRGEALGLRWDDIDPEARIMRVQGTLARVDGSLQVTAPLPSHMRQSWGFFGFPADVEDPFADLAP